MWAERGPTSVIRPFASMAIMLPAANADGMDVRLFR
jgi:hypothetical protein